MILLIGVACVAIMGRPWIICRFLVRMLKSYSILSSNLFGFLGSYKKWCLSSIWLEELAGEKLIKHLEFSTVVFVVVHMVGM